MREHFRLVVVARRIRERQDGIRGQATDRGGGKASSRESSIRNEHGGVHVGRLGAVKQVPNLGGAVQVLRIDGTGIQYSHTSRRIPLARVVGRCTGIGILGQPNLNRLHLARTEARKRKSLLNSWTVRRRY